MPRRHGPCMRKASAAGRIFLAVLLSVSISGCGASRPDLPPPPAILMLPDCPSPARPALPRINGDLPFDAPENTAAFLERDDIFRLHVMAQDSALACYKRMSTHGKR